MNLFLLLFVHIIIGLGFICFCGKLPKVISTFAFAFATMGLIYFGAVFLNTFL